MAKYKITDNQTGKSVIVSGDHQPSTTEAESIFQQAGLRQSKKGTIDKVTDFLFGRTKDYGKMLGSAGLALGAEGAIKMGKGDLAQTLAQKSMDIRQQQGTTGNLEEGTALETAKRGAGITAGAMGETAAYLMPQNALLKSGKIGTRIAGGALQGGEIGALLGATNPEAKNIGERAKGAVTQGAMGAVAGGVVQGGLEGVSWGLKQVGKATNYLKEKGYNIIANNFKESGAAQDVINRHGGPEKFAKEIVDNKIPKSKPGAIKYLDKLNKEYDKQVNAKLQQVSDKKAIDFNSIREELIKDAEKRFRLPTQKAELEQAKAFINAFGNYESEMSAKSANALRKQLDKSFSGKSQLDIKQGEKWANDMMANRLRKGVQDVVPITKAFFKKYSLTKDVIETYFKEPKAGIIELVGGMSGALPAMAFTRDPLTSLLGLLAGVGVGKASRSPGLQRSIGAGLSRLPSMGNKQLSVGSPLLTPLLKSVLESYQRVGLNP